MVSSRLFETEMQSSPAGGHLLRLQRTTSSKWITHEQAIVTKKSHKERCCETFPSSIGDCCLAQQPLSEVALRLGVT